MIMSDLRLRRGSSASLALAPRSGIDQIYSAMQAALELEKTVNQALLDLHKIVDKHGDFQMSDFIEGNYLHEAIKELGGYVTSPTSSVLVQVMVNTTLTMRPLVTKASSRPFKRLSVDNSQAETGSDQRAPGSLAGSAPSRERKG